MGTGGGGSRKWMARARAGGLTALVAAVRGNLEDFRDRLLEIKSFWSVMFLTVLTPLLLAPRIGPDLPVLAAGSIVPQDIIAPATNEFEDVVATREVRQAARDAVLPVYDLDSLALDNAVKTVRGTFARAREALQSISGKNGTTLRRGEIARHLTAAAELRMPPETVAYLSGNAFDAAAEERMIQALREVLRRRIVGSKSYLPSSGRLTVRDSRTGREWKEERQEGLLSLDEARALAVEALGNAGSVAQERAALDPYISDLITPTLTFNGALTEQRKTEAAARIEPLIVRIPKGKVLLRRGEVVSEEAARTLAALDAARLRGTSGRVILGNLLFVTLLLFFMSRYVFFYQRSYRRERHLFALLLVVMIFSLLLDRGFVWMYENLVDTLRVEPFDNPDFYRFMIPVAAGSMLVTLLSNARVGMAYALFYVPLFGMMMEWDLALLLFCLVSNLAAIYGISTYRQRTALIKAGLILGAVNAVAVLALQSVSGDAAPLTHLAFKMFCGLVGGLLVAILVSFVLPLLESFFNLLTDVRLLELSNLNNPLLRRLAVEAPGSYNHSVIVGTLAEAAAEAIGANALFCRVGAYYHDVGKMLKPDYFIENQRDGVNRHDQLSPHMSALVIASHVKEGYELARSYGLPKQVLDIIPQHHGTRKINYFYQKAKKREKPELQEVQEADFRYPGPKPQTREAAIFMLSDSIEAAARTLEDPSPARFKGLIRKIVSDVVLDDQFTECDLTFADLDRVSASFLKTLSSIYHNRIDYPGFEFDKIPERPFHGSRSHEGAPESSREWGKSRS